MSYPVVDLHCDLLTYLNSNSQRTAYDAKVRCSIPQLRAGGVKLQVLAIWGITKAGSAVSGMSQAKIFSSLPTLYPEDFYIANEGFCRPQKIGILPAIESASAISEEGESLELAFERLKVIESIAKPVYISLTWNSENRFGGGNLTNVGLKEDGKRLLDHLNQRGIAVDFSHTSDHLAEDILKYLDQEKLDISVLASHSNFRAITNVPRNLPDSLIQEILRRQGVIGLNFLRSFIGGEEEAPLFAEHLSHALKLGAQGQVGFGGDFFCDEDVPADLKNTLGPSFFKKYPNASIYGEILSLWKEKLFLSQEALVSISSQNLLNFLKRLNHIN